MSKVRSDGTDLIRSALRPSTSALRPSPFALRPSTFDLRPSTFDLRPSDLRTFGPSTAFHCSLGTRHSALGTRHSALGTRHSALGTRHSALGTAGVCSFGSEKLEHMALNVLSPLVPQTPPSLSETAVTDSITGYFCRVADTVGLPRSAAQIYSTLFVADAPISFTQVVERSGLSKASASTGLKLLERMRAVEIVVIPSERGTHYRPELSMRRLAAGFLEETLLPGLEAGGRLLDEATQQADDHLPAHLNERLSSLQRWHELTQDLIPALTLLDGGKAESRKQKTEN
ncbi:GbsR/MarR family transcriptional regulator [Haloferula sp.]|uniref:GbsR/MarR family transcriptional regulator n=1 Tax=Haloferula sp. TaxID=2497595 RepID=UPI003C7555AF